MLQPASLIMSGFELWQVERDGIIDCPSGEVRICCIQIYSADRSWLIGTPSHVLLLIRAGEPVEIRYWPIVAMCSTSDGYTGCQEPAVLDFRHGPPRSGCMIQWPCVLPLLPLPHSPLSHPWRILSSSFVPPARSCGRRSLPSRRTSRSLYTELKVKMFIDVPHLWQKIYLKM